MTPVIPLRIPRDRLSYSYTDSPPSRAHTPARLHPPRRRCCAAPRGARRPAPPGARAASPPSRPSRTDPGSLPPLLRPALPCAQSTT